MAFRGGDAPGHDGRVIDLVAAATDRLLATVDRLPEAGWAAESGCAGWSRAHVIAHLALNAEGLGGAVQGVLEGVPALMYTSSEDRDTDIAALSTAPPEKVRARLREASQRLAATLADLPTVPEDATFERTPGGPRLRAHLVPLLRLREVEIHHADLEAGYTAADWPRDTAERFLEHDARRYDGPPVSAYATDLDRTYPLGDPAGDAPRVSGPAAALAWWLSGRDPGDLLTSSTGTLPEMEGR
jgi:maleylpyruvate isomerase